MLKNRETRSKKINELSASSNQSDGSHIQAGRFLPLGAVVSLLSRYMGYRSAGEVHLK